MNFQYKSLIKFALISGKNPRFFNQKSEFADLLGIGRRTKKFFTARKIKLHLALEMIEIFSIFPIEILLRNSYKIHKKSRFFDKKW